MRRNISEPACAVTRRRRVGSDDHGAVARVTAQQRGQRAGAAVLLADHAGHAEAAAQPHAGVAHGAGGGQRAAQAALHVDGAAAVHPAVTHLRAERRRRPRGSSPAGTTSMWPLSMRSRPPPGSPVQPTTPTRLVALHLVAPVGVRGESREVDIPLVDAQARRRAARPRRRAARGSRRRRGSGRRSAVRSSATRPSRSSASRARRSRRPSAAPVRISGCPGSLR